MESSLATADPGGHGRPLRLYALGGADAPPDLGADLARLARLPREALEHIWEVLTPSLADTIAPETERLLDVFCSAYRVDDDDLARAIKGCRFLLRGAAQRDVPKGAVADDLARLCPEQPLVQALVLAGYEPLRAQLRREIIKAAVIDHGKLLLGVHWRVDTIRTSDRGDRLGMPVAMLTLHYREGAEEGRVTLQALPDMIGELRSVCDRIVKGSSEGAQRTP